MTADHKEKIPFLTELEASDRKKVENIVGDFIDDLEAIYDAPDLFSLFNNLFIDPDQTEENEEHHLRESFREIDEEFDQSLSKLVHKFPRTLYTSPERANWARRICAATNSLLRYNPSEELNSDIWQAALLANRRAVLLGARVTHELTGESIDQAFLNGLTTDLMNPNRMYSADTERNLRIFVEAPPLKKG